MAYCLTRIFIRCIPEKFSLSRIYSSRINLDESVFSLFMNKSLGGYVKRILEKNIDGNKQIVFPWKDSISTVTQIEQLMDKFCDIQNNLTSLQELKKESADDVEFTKSLNEEFIEYKHQLVDIENHILKLLLPKTDCNHDRVMLEVSTGVGGQEAMLFAQDLFRMYCGYATYKGWEYDIADYSESDLGGLRRGCMLISGNESYKILSFEGGVHRVQRIPKTERGGRTHTSTVSVAVVPQPSEVEVVINKSDLKIETKHSSGPGGQHVNKTLSAVRIHHIPTGTIVECEVGRLQNDNKEMAMKKLRAILYQMELSKIQTATKNSRKNQVGTSSRNEKIRTYNYGQDRVTDHRIGKTIYNVELFMEGNVKLDELINALMRSSEENSMAQFLKSLENQ